MARVSDVVSSSRDTSPDPITLASSPLVGHSGRKTRSTPSPRKMNRNRRSATPSKSVFLDTPAAGNESPWRIKVTVEAEPRDASPGRRMTRTTSVPLKDSDMKRSTSPSKRTSAQKANAGEIKRPARKRKGTPLRDTRPARPCPQPEPEPTTEEEEEEDSIPEQSHSPARRASGRLARLSAQPGSARSKRLSYARDELDQALQKAVGYSDMGSRCDAPGDMTTSKNEDFSMISMESLQSAKETSMSNVMQTIPEGDKSAASVSYMPSSPPKVRYPNIQHKAERARSSLGKSVVNAYDPMSWKPTGILKKSSPRSMRKQQEQGLGHESQWQKERESVSQKIDSANPEDVLVVDDIHDDAEEDDEQGAAAMDEDIWQDEASRSLEDDQSNYRSKRPVNDQPKQRSPQMEDLFAGQPLKPLRSKIPRTWRRSSGMDFSYVDSPAHEPPEEPQDEVEQEFEDELEEEHEEEPQQTHGEAQTHDRRQSTDGSGVLTPPSTEEESEGFNEEIGDYEGYEESEFEPDAEATRFHDVAEEDGAETPGPDESDSSPDGEDAGNFQTDIPHAPMNERPRRRPPRQKTMDLTELLNLDGANSPVKASVTGYRAGPSAGPKVGLASSSSQPRRSSPQMRAVDVIKSGLNEMDNGKVIGSPLRKSFFKSSKMPDRPSRPEEKRDVYRRYAREPRRQEPSHAHSRFVRMQDADPGDSFESKASDQRQLLSEAAMAEEQQDQRHHENHHEDDEEEEEMAEDVQPQSAYQPYAESEEYYKEDDLEEMDEGEEEYIDEAEFAEPSGSYEERLNLDSPQKIGVTFNDSTQSSSWLANKKPCPPLFDRPNALRFPHATEQSTTQTDTSGTFTLIDKKPEPASSQPSFFSRLSSTFWNAVVGQPDPAKVVPTQEECTMLFSPSLRAQIRARYGVVSEQFPWTFNHMRILHRMLNSLTSNRYDSIIPRSGPLPLYLENIIGTFQKCIVPEGYEYRFTKEHAYVILSFIQVTVSIHLIEAMRRGEVEALGDEEAKKWSANPRTPGDMIVFKTHLHGSIADWVDSHKGRIGMDFVIRALGTCLNHNVQFEKKWGMPFQELQRRDLVGKLPPGHEQDD